MGILDTLTQEQLESVNKLLGELNCDEYRCLFLVLDNAFGKTCKKQYDLGYADGRDLTRGQKP